MLDRNLLQRLIVAMPEGTWELVTHPGYNDGDLTKARTATRLGTKAPPSW